MESVELTPKEKEAVLAFRLTLTDSLARLGCPIRVGWVNFDNHELTIEDVAAFNRDIDQATTDALIRIRN